MPGARRRLKWAAGVLGGAGVFLLLVSLFVDLRYRARIHRADGAPDAPVAIVFGAGLAPNGLPSPVLAERLDAAIALYQAGKVKKLLVSGDNSEVWHDETKAMRRYASEKGLPTTDVVGDFAGFSTYDTCFRAREIFGVSRAILVTQRFHLPRALFIANSLGIDADGVAADPEGVDFPYALRELLSRPLALAMVLTRPDPKFLGPRQPIGK